MPCHAVPSRIHCERTFILIVQRANADLRSDHLCTRFKDAEARKDRKFAYIPAVTDTVALVLSSLYHRNTILAGLPECLPTKPSPWSPFSTPQLGRYSLSSLLGPHHTDALDNFHRLRAHERKKVKGEVFPYTRYRALGPELIPVYRQSPASDFKPSTRRCRHAVNFIHLLPDSCLPSFTTRHSRRSLILNCSTYSGKVCLSMFCLLRHTKGVDLTGLLGGHKRSGVQG